MGDTNAGRPVTLFFSITMRSHPWAGEARLPARSDDKQSCPLMQSFGHACDVRGVDKGACMWGCRMALSSVLAVVQSVLSQTKAGFASLRGSSRRASQPQRTGAVQSTASCFPHNVKLGRGFVRRNLWTVFGLKVLEAYGFFSLSLIFTIYFTEKFGVSDLLAGTYYGLWGTLTTVYGFAFGGIVDVIGVRTSLVLCNVLHLCSRSEQSAPTICSAP